MQFPPASPRVSENLAICNGFHSRQYNSLPSWPVGHDLTERVAGRKSRFSCQQARNGLHTRSFRFFACAVACVIYAVASEAACFTLLWPRSVQFECAVPLTLVHSQLVWFGLMHPCDRDSNDPLSVLCVRFLRNFHHITHSHTHFAKQHQQWASRILFERKWKKGMKNMFKKMEISRTRFTTFPYIPVDRLQKFM